MSTLLTVTRITKSFGFNTVLDGVSFVVSAGERVGIVGANGVGKSTLLKIITGELPPDDGNITIAAGRATGYLAQTLADADQLTLAGLIDRTLAEARALEAEMRQLAFDMATAEGDTLTQALERYGDAAERFEALGGYDLDTRVDEVFSGLGIGHLDRARPIATLSGGEGARAALALLLLRAPDLLLLDEPTNHLDAGALEWLETTLSRYRGTLVVVSHDRQFLNRIATAILEIDEHKRTVRRYPGNYDAYYAAKVQERRRWELDYAKQQEEIKALRQTFYVDARQSTYRTPTDGDGMMIGKKRDTHAFTVSRKVREAETRLERILADPIPKPPEPLTFDPDFDPRTPHNRPPLRIEELTRCYNGRAILKAVSLDVPPGARIAITGPNGAGKSTLLRVLAGVDQPDAGAVRRAAGIIVGYLPQEADFPRPHATLYEAFADGLLGNDVERMNLLLRTGLFRYDDTSTPVGSLSAGQRRKLQLARLMALRANLLLLDEPTNHLSLDVLEELEAALKVFAGTVVAVSHDRRFLAAFGGVEWRVGDGEVQVM